MIGILDKMQIVDQVLTLPRPVAKQRRDLELGLWLVLAALGQGRGTATSSTRMLEACDGSSWCFSHRSLPRRPAPGPRFAVTVI